ncbi:MAG: YqeG family HAD IIIA-type phosphatase [Armatimonadota bacterium]
MSFKTGSFSSTGRVLRPFTPARAVQRITDLDPADLFEEGKRLVLMDVDNTLVYHNSIEAEPAIREWLERARQVGLELCIVSNTNRVSRLNAIASGLGVEIVRGRMKPSRSMFTMALAKFGRRPEETIMVGDQLITDVFGANRSGIDAIWVEKMPDSREFVGTRVNRIIERVLAGQIYRSLVPATVITDADEPVIDSPAAVIAELEAGEGVAPNKRAALIRQITKFLMVGASSFAIDFTITYLLHKKLSIGGVLVSDTVGRWLMETAPSLFGGTSEPGKASFWISVLIAATIATYNGFYWNRRWTFRVSGDEGRARQLRRVYILGYIGMGLNAAFSQLFLNIIPGHQGQSIFVAKLLAAMVVASYNFIGQRFWAFR